MEAVMVAMAILMWMWGAASLHLVQGLLPVNVPGRAAWLGLTIAIGGGLLVALLHLALPDSLLSQGWSREMLSSTQQWTTVLVIAGGVAGLLRGIRRLDPAPAPTRGVTATASTTAAAKAAAASNAAVAKSAAASAASTGGDAKPVASVAAAKRPATAVAPGTTPRVPGKQKSPPTKRRP